jgi:hypothetical protein
MARKNGNKKGKEHFRSSPLGKYVSELNFTENGSDRMNLKILLSIVVPERPVEKYFMIRERCKAKNNHKS